MKSMVQNNVSSFFMRGHPGGGGVAKLIENVSQRNNRRIKQTINMVNYREREGTGLETRFL